MSLWGYGLIFSIFGWSNRELIFKDSDLKQWSLKVIFSSSCDKENNNCPKEINFQIPEAAKKEIKKLKISQAFGPQSHTALCKAKHNHSKQMQRSLGNVFLRSIYNRWWAKNKKLRFCNSRICWDKSWIKPLKKCKGLMEIKIGLYTLSRLTTFLSSFYPTDTGSKPSRRPLGNDISLSSHLNDLSKTHWGQCSFSPK